MKLISSIYDLCIKAEQITETMCKDLVKLGQRDTGLESYHWTVNDTFAVVVSNPSVLDDICDILQIPCVLVH